MQQGQTHQGTAGQASSGTQYMLTLWFVGKRLRPAAFEEPSLDVRTFSSLEAALAHARREVTVPDLLVLFEPRPGCLCADRLAALRACAPLARVLVISESWCEGPRRSDPPLPGVIRLAWHQWPTHLRAELDRLKRERLPLWALPVTAGDDERLLFDRRDDRPRGRGLVMIESPQAEMRDWIGQACRRQGWATAAQSPWQPAAIDGVTLGIWDGETVEHGGLERLAAFITSMKGAPTIVLLDFPRRKDQRQITAVGASALVAKPLLLPDLWQQIEHVVSDGDRALAQR